MISVLSGCSGAEAISWFQALLAGNMGQPPMCGPGGVSLLAGSDAVAPPTIVDGAAVTTVAIPIATTTAAVIGQRRNALSRRSGSSFASASRTTPG